MDVEPDPPQRPTRSSADLPLTLLAMGIVVPYLVWMATLAYHLEWASGSHPRWFRACNNWLNSHFTIAYCVPLFAALVLLSLSVVVRARRR